MTIDTNSEDFQLGRKLYDAQCLLADIASGGTPSIERIQTLAKNYCWLVSITGMLRAEYDCLLREHDELKKAIGGLVS